MVTTGELLFGLADDAPRAHIFVFLPRELASYVDLAAERGGNCELTRTGETVQEHGVTIIGAINLASSVPYHASQMYARNVAAFLLHIIKDGKLRMDMTDEIIRDTLLTRDGEVKNARVRDFFSLPALPA